MTQNMFDLIFITVFCCIISIVSCSSSSTPEGGVEIDHENVEITFLPDGE